MASSKELPHSSRPSQHRLSMSTNTGSSLPNVRQSHSRGHSHSVSSGSLIPSHRVTRRKSISSNANNVAAMAAVVRENGDIVMPISVRRNTTSKSASARSAALGSLPSPPASLPGHRMNLTSNGKTADREENAIEDDEDMEDDEDNAFSKARIRRASEGQQLSGSKKVHMNDLKCEKCGKGYKHSSCLTKHLWEHTPEWSYTSKLLISKHQQVQLLEAASVLVAMNQDGTSPPDSAKDFQSDQESASPAASGSSENDRASSADTTPPPQGDTFNTYNSGSYSDRAKRHSSGSGGFSRSYQSAPTANPLYVSSVLGENGLGHHRQPSHERRPPSSGCNRTGQEDDQIAAAFDLLSCSHGSYGSMPRTPRTIPVTLPEDAPPVPTIPEKFLSGTHFSTTLPPSLHPRQTESYTRHRIHHDEDVKMEESDQSIADDEDYDRHSRGRSDEDDEGVFGRMEE